MKAFFLLIPSAATKPQEAASSLLTIFASQARCQGVFFSQQRIRCGTAWSAPCLHTVLPPSCSAELAIRRAEDLGLTARALSGAEAAPGTGRGHGRA
eukprot:scaffold13_cov241-Pinguiococcus_pyrenoidosus.AAC.33